MMNLELQIKSLSYSIFFGMFFSAVFNFMYPFFFNKNKFFGFSVSLLFMLLNASLYFLLLSLINDGILNSYLFLSFLMGFIIGNIKTKKIRQRT